MPKLEARTLPYLLPLTKDKVDKQTIRGVVTKILRQKDFSVSCFALALGQLVEFHEGKSLTEDLEFWR